MKNRIFISIIIVPTALLLLFIIFLINTTDLSNQKAMDYCNAGDYESAISEYDRLLKILPNDDCLLNSKNACLKKMHLSKINDSTTPSLADPQ